MFGLGLTRILPPAARDWLAHGMVGLDRAYGLRLHPWLVVAGRGRRPRFQGRRVVVAGLLSSPSGLGRGARLMIKEFAASNVPVFPVDLTRRFGHPVESAFPGAQDPRAAAAWQPSDILVQLNPPDFGRVLRLFPLGLLRRVSITGYWVWELGTAPAFWRQNARYCGEIWVPSDFVAESLRAGGCAAVEVKVVPHQVDREPMRRRDPGRGREVRAALGIAPNAFVVGATWSMRSSFERKGARMAIEVFSRSFAAQDGRHVLLLRCLDGDVYPAGMRVVREAAAGDPRIVLLDGPPLPVRMTDFYDAIEVYLSLTRGEGYGLTIAEAAQAGLPVLATAWGLAADLAARPGIVPIKFELVPVVDPQGVYVDHGGAVWAEPDLDDASRHLRALAGAAAEPPRRPGQVVEAGY